MLIPLRDDTMLGHRYEHMRDPEGTNCILSSKERHNLDEQVVDSRMKLAKTGKM